MAASKLLYRVVSVICVVVLFAACAAEPTAVPPTPTAKPAEPTSPPPTEGAIPDDELVEPGKLILATTGNAAPFTLVGDDGELTGYDVELCTKIAERLGMETEWVVLEWSGILPGLSTGRFDMVCTGVGRTPERLASPDFLFSDATIQDGTGMVVQAGDDRIKTWDDARGMKMGGVRGAYYSSDVTELLGGDVELAEYPGETELFLDLENGRIDFATMGFLVAAVRARDNANFELGAPPFNPTTKGLPINKNASTLLAEVNRLVKEFTESGELEALHVKWFGTPALPQE